MNPLIIRNPLISQKGKIPTSQKFDRGRNKIKLDPIKEPVDRQKKLQKLVKPYCFFILPLN